MTATDWVQAIAMVVLVGVTIFYAYQAKKARDSAEASAQASVKMAEEMREQRYSESLPLLVPDIWSLLQADPNEVDYESLGSGQGIHVGWRNMGKGTAINSRFSFYPVPTISGKAEAFPSHRLGTLEVGGKKEFNFDKIFERYNRETKLLDDKRWHQISDEYQPRLEAEYQDIYERKITTVQEFRIDEQNKRAFLGELYFTVNGRRLGEEITRHD